MFLVAALLNDGTSMILSVGCVLSSITPDSWALAEILTFVIPYNLYLRPDVPLANDFVPHMITYPQAAIIS